MDTIYKYGMPINDIITLQLPIGAKILDVQPQNGNPFIWCLVDPNVDTEVRHFEVFGTGHKMSTGMGVNREYIGTFQTMGGALVFHLFERL
jgi:hypothetical protein